MAGKDFYQILGVTLEATQKEIKHAYRLLARKYHPDVSSVRNAEEKFKTMGEAYEVLKNPTKRSEYDRQYNQRSQAKPRTKSSTKPNSSSRQNYSSRTNSSSRRKRSSAFNEAQFNERHAAELNSIYGDQYGVNQKNSRENNFNLDGRDIHARVFIDLEHSLNGTSQQFNVQIPVFTPQGDLINKSKFLNVRIPQGIRAGDIIRLAKQGSPGMGAAAGDFLIEVVFNPHEFYTVEGSNIYLNLKVTPEQLKLGARIMIPSPNHRFGNITITIPEDSRNGARQHFVGHGLPSQIPGDFYVTLQATRHSEDSVNSNVH